MGNEIDDTVVTTKVKSALLAGPGVKSFDIAVLTRKVEGVANVTVELGIKK